jgi:hypothetical protein
MGNRDAELVFYCGGLFLDFSLASEDFRIAAIWARGGRGAKAPWPPAAIKN